VRFANRRGGTAGWSYDVPSDKRAVVRAFSALAFTSIPASVIVFVNACPVLYWVASAPNTSTFAEVRWVAYPGDQLQFSVAGADVALHISGFLFGDDGSAPAPAAGAAEAGRGEIPELPPGHEVQW
jgi:hypothetical protein